LVEVREAVDWRRTLARLHQMDVAANRAGPTGAGYARRKQELEEEISAQRNAWVRRDVAHRSGSCKELEEGLKKQRQREIEDYEYKKALERKKAQDKYGRGAAAPWRRRPGEARGAGEKLAAAGSGASAARRGTGEAAPRGRAVPQAAGEGSATGGGGSHQQTEARFERRRCCCAKTPSRRSGWRSCASRRWRRRWLSRRRRLSRCRSSSTKPSSKCRTSPSRPSKALQARRPWPTSTRSRWSRPSIARLRAERRAAAVPSAGLDHVGPNRKAGAATRRWERRGETAFPGQSIEIGQVLADRDARPQQERRARAARGLQCRRYSASRCHEASAGIHEQTAGR